MSPRLPRDVSGPDLVKLLETFAYVVMRRKGSHLRLTTQQGGEHHIAVSNHDSLRTGTLNGILKDVAEHARVQTCRRSAVPFGMVENATPTW